MTQRAGRCTLRRGDIERIRKTSSSRPPIQSGPALSTVWRGQVATPTGFLAFDYSISAKWLELLKEVVIEW
jgi:hypothetical protein